MTQESQVKSRSDSITLGAVLIGLGVIFLLGRLDVVDIGDLFSTFWPLILVGVGVKMIWDRNRKDDGGTGGKREVISEDGPIQLSKTFGDLDLTIDSKAFEGGRFSTTLGDLKIDLSAANIGSGEKHLKLSGTIGDIKIMLPPSLKVSAVANTSIGDLNILNAKKDGFGVRQDYKSSGYESARKKLAISASQGIGDITILQAKSAGGKK